MLLASQLLRIPQILHADEDYDTCDFDTAESEPRMEGVLKPAADSANLKSDIRRDDYFFNAPEYECSIILDNFTSSKESELKDTITFMKGTHFYSNTKRSDCELPEFIVCYRDNRCHGIKDICIDERALSSDKKNDIDFLFKREQVSFSRKDSATVDCLDIKNEDKTSSDSDSEAGKENCNASDGDIIDDASDNLVPDKDSPQASLKALSESSGNGQISMKEPEKKKCPASILCYDSKVESGTITFNFKSRKNPSTTSRNSKTVDQPREFRDENFYGGSARPSSDFITYSGQIPCSGSLSLGSDSSTTSNRSFAFPVLQQEWISSPVRMAKAERGHFRKFRSWGWRTRLLCCRF